MPVRSSLIICKHISSRNIIGLLLMLLCLFLLSGCEKAPQTRDGNLFDQSGPGIRRSWKPQGTLTLENQGRQAGEPSIKISTEEANDIRHLRTISVFKGHFYRFSAWVKTEAVKGPIGANLSVYGTYNHSQLTLAGDTLWTYIEQVFRACEDDQLDFALRLGFWDSPAVGTAWFSEVQLDELAEWSGPYQAIQKTPPKGPRSSMPLRFFIFLGFVPWLVAFLYTLRNDRFSVGNLPQTCPNLKRSVIFFWLLMFAALGIQLLIAPYDGMTSEFARLKSLALDLGQPQQFFQTYADQLSGQYPLLLNLYFAVIGWLVRLGCGETSAFFTLLLKLPAIAMNLAVAGLLFHCSSRVSRKHAWLILVLFLFNPAVLFSTAFWGQTTTFSAGLLVFAIYSLSQRRVFAAGLLLGALCGYSLQWPFLVVFLLITLLIQGTAAQCLRAAAGVLITATSLFLAVFFRHDLLQVLGNFRPSLPELNQLSLNACNFWALLGLNWQSADNLLLGIAGSLWGVALALLTLAALILVLVKHRGAAKPSQSKLPTTETIASESPWKTFALLTLGLFLFLPFQQGHNLLPTVFLLAFLLLNNRLYAWAFCGASTLCFLNQIFVFWYPAYQNSLPPTDALLQPIGGGILLLAFLALLRGELKVKTDSIDRVLACVLDRIPQSFKIGAVTTQPAPPVLEDFNSGHQPFSMKNWDWCALALIWAVAAGLLLFNLGKIHFPTQGHQIVDRPEVFDIDLGSATTLTEVGFYGGEIAPEVRFEAWTGERWRALWGNDDGFLIYPAATDYRKTFKNKQRSFRPVETSRIRVIVKGKESTLQELALFGSNNQLIVPQSISEHTTAGVNESQPATSHPFFDEQEKVGPFARHLTNSYWDEVFYARSAYNLLNGQPPYEKTHPPLGKSIIGFGIRWFGMTPFGWRIMPALAISLLPLLLFSAGRWLSGRRLGAYLAAALCLFECLAISIGRIANIDGFLVLFQTAMLIALLRWFIAGDGEVKRKNLPWLLLAGICFGLAVSIKWSAIFCGFGIFLLVVGWHIRHMLQLSRQDQQIPTNQLKRFFQQTLPKNLALWCGCFVVLPFAIYYFSHYEFLQSLAAKPSLWSTQGVEAFWEQQKFIIGFHGGKKAFESHSLASPFYTWPLLAKPVQEIYINSRLADNFRSTISMVGNPVIFWLGLLAMLGWAWQALKGQCRTAILLSGCYFAQFLPWILVQRPSFFYAYFPFVPILILGLATATGSAPKYTKRTCAALLLSSSAIFLLFYPAISGLPMPAKYFEWLHWFDSWSNF